MERKQLECQILNHYEALCQYATRRLGNDKDAAKDVVQHALTDCLAGCEEFVGEQESAVRQWLFESVKTNLIDIYRRQRRSIEDLDADTAIPSDEDDAPRVDRTVTIEDAAEKVEIKVDVQKALASLPASDRLIAVANLLEGFTYKEIAEAHGIPERSVRYRLKDIIIPKLKRELRAYKV